MRIVRVKGIEIRVHLTFFLLLLWLLVSDYEASRSYVSAASGMLFTILIFCVVVLHELGHALAAARFGIRTKQIMLLPIGGVASLERIPKEPYKEFVIAIAGPLVNIALAALAYLTAVLLGLQLSISNVDSIAVRFISVNLLLAVFNLIPAFPMDGGRILRALLAVFIDRSTATAVAAGIGQAIAVLFAIIGFFYQPILILTALFVWMGAKSEVFQVQMESRLQGLTVEDVMTRHFDVLLSEWSLPFGAQFASEKFQSCFPVLHGNELVGAVAFDRIIQNLSEPNVKNIGDVMEGPVATASIREPMTSVMQRWQEAGGDLVAIVDEGGLVGIITPQQLARHLSLASNARRGRELPASTTGRFSSPRS